jgi:enoyl-CoA hydratase/carnithine racemase
LDCECCENTIEFLYAFDLCLATEKAILSKLPKKEKSGPLIRFISGNKNLDNLYALETISSRELLKFGFINKVVSSVTLKSEIEDYVIPMIVKKSKVQILSIKTCFRAYKQAVLEGKNVYEDRMESERQETEQFCKLALIKSKELEKNYVS